MDLTSRNRVFVIICISTPPKLLKKKKKKKKEKKNRKHAKRYSKERARVQNGNAA